MPKNYIIFRNGYGPMDVTDEFNFEGNRLGWIEDHARVVRYMETRTTRPDEDVWEVVGEWDNKEAFLADVEKYGKKVHGLH